MWQCASVRMQRPAPVRRRDFVLAAFAGVMVAASANQSFANNAGWGVDITLLVALYAASVGAAFAMCATGIPQFMAARNAAFWEGGALARLGTAWAFCACASLVASLVVILFFGTPPAR